MVSFIPGTFAAHGFHQEGVHAVGHLKDGVQSRDSLRPQPIVWRASSQYCLHGGGRMGSFSESRRAQIATQGAFWGHDRRRKK
ncbi:hypothetical protein KCU61_g648, partial [Aureobasidium melanogenum]